MPVWRKSMIKKPKFDLLDILKEKWIYSEFPKKWLRRIYLEEKGFYLSEELIHNDFDLINSKSAKTASVFATMLWRTRPTIQNYIKWNRIIYLDVWYYDLELLKNYLINSIK